LKAVTIVGIVCLFALLFIPPSRETGLTNPVAQGLILTVQGQAHQQVSPGCYNAQIQMSAIWNDTGTFAIFLPDFYLYGAGANLQVANSTYYSQPNNRINSLLLFPNVSIALILSFTKFCLVTGATQVWLFYSDGTVTFKQEII
jgi:hypothetical protein